MRHPNQQRQSTDGNQLVIEIGLQSYQNHSTALEFPTRGKSPLRTKAGCDLSYRHKHGKMNATYVRRNTKQSDMSIINISKHNVKKVQQQQTNDVSILELHCKTFQRLQYARTITAITYVQLTQRNTQLHRLTECILNANCRMGRLFARPLVPNLSEITWKL